MNINVAKIEEIYGLEILSLVLENISDVIKNMNYLNKLEFNDVEDIFERYVLIFICGSEEFKLKINNLIS